MRSCPRLTLGWTSLAWRTRPLPRVSPCAIAQSSHSGRFTTCTCKNILAKMQVLALNPLEFSPDLPRADVDDGPPGPSFSPVADGPDVNAADGEGGAQGGRRRPRPEEDEDGEPEVSESLLQFKGPAAAKAETACNKQQPYQGCLCLLDPKISPSVLLLACPGAPEAPAAQEAAPPEVKCGRPD